MTVGNIVLAAAVVAVILCLLLYFVCSYLFRVGMEARFQRKAPRKKKTAHPPTLRQRQLQQAAQARRHGGRPSPLSACRSRAG